MSYWANHAELMGLMKMTDCSPRTIDLVVVPYLHINTRRHELLGKPCRTDGLDEDDSALAPTPSVDLHMNGAPLH